MTLDNADYWRLVSCVGTIIHLAEGAGRLPDVPATVAELCSLVELTEQQQEAIDKLVSSATGF